jgi:hypothetical protein
MEGLENVSVPGFYPDEFGDMMLRWSLRRSADMWKVPVCGGLVNARFPIRASHTLQGLSTRASFTYTNYRKKVKG